MADSSGRPSPSARPGPAPPGHRLGTRGLWRVLLVLCLTEIVSWGVLYYAFPVLAPSIAQDTGWSVATVTAAFSAGLIVSGLVGIPAGRWLDRVGPRPVMTLGSALGVPAVLGVASAESLVGFFAAWLLAGAAMAGVLYPPAFAALTRWWGPRRVTALTTLTLLAGLSSTIFAPLTATLLDRLGWRQSYLVLAALLAVITVPAHLFGLRGHWPAADRDTEQDDGELSSDAEPSQDVRRTAAQDNKPHGAQVQDTNTPGTDAQGATTRGMDTRAGTDEGGREPRAIARSRPFALLVLAVSLGTFTAFAVVVNQVPLLIERGMSTSGAAWALGLGGLGQVLGRLGYRQLASVTGVRGRAVLILAMSAAATALLAVLPGPAGLLIAAAMLAGAARGVFTLLQATAISDRWGTEHYGRLNGLLSAPAMIATALAPWAGAALAEALGGYPALFGLLAIVGAVAAGLAFGSVPRPSHS